MAGLLGITENTATEASQLFAGQDRVIEDITVKAGESAALLRGSPLCRGADGKFYCLDLEADVEGEVILAADGNIKTISKMLAAGKLVPGTVTIKSTVGAAARQITDNGAGRFDDAQHKGFVDYDSGRIEVDFATAPDNATEVTVDYTKQGANGDASVIAANSEAVDCTADALIPALSQGGVISGDLCWPANITADQKNRVIEKLRAFGIVAI